MFNIVFFLSYFVLLSLFYGSFVDILMFLYTFAVIAVFFSPSFFFFNFLRCYQPQWLWRQWWNLILSLFVFCYYFIKRKKKGRRPSCFVVSLFLMVYKGWEGKTVATLTNLKVSKCGALTRFGIVSITKSVFFWGV